MSAESSISYRWETPDEHDEDVSCPIIRCGECDEWFTDFATQYVPHWRAEHGQEVVA